MVSIREGDLLPPTCIVSGGAPEWLRTVVYKGGHFKEQPEDHFAMISALISLATPVGTLIRMAEKRFAEDENALEVAQVSVPVSSDFKNDESLNHPHFDEKTMSITVPAHIKFRNDFEELNLRLDVTAKQGDESLFEGEPHWALYIAIFILGILELVGIVFAIAVANQINQSGEWLNNSTLAAIIFTIGPLLVILGCLKAIRNKAKVESNPYEQNERQ